MILKVYIFLFKQPLSVEALEGVISSSVVNVEGILLPRFANVIHTFYRHSVNNLGWFFYTSGRK